MRRLTAAAAAAAAALGLAACSPDAADFQEEAEKYIESREFSEAARLVEYTEAQCEEPESTAEDTIYTCTATAEDGSQWMFDVEITGKSDLVVINPPTPADGTGSTIRRLVAVPDTHRRAAARRRRAGADDRGAVAATDERPPPAASDRGDDRRSSIRAELLRGGRLERDTARRCRCRSRRRRCTGRSGRPASRSASSSPFIV